MNLDEDVDCIHLIKNSYDHDGEHYPLKADPLFCTDTINNTKTKWNLSYGGRVEKNYCCK